MIVGKEPLLPAFLFLWITISFLQAETAVDYDTSEAYLQQRQEIFHSTKSSNDLERSAHMATVMESTLGNSVFTTVAWANGTAALYVSSEGKTKTSRDTAEAVTAVRKYMDFSASFASRMKPVTEFPLPSPGHVRFYIIKGNTIFTGEYLENKIIFMEHPLCRLFLKGHSLMEHLDDIEKTGSPAGNTVKNQSHSYPANP